MKHPLTATTPPVGSEDIHSKETAFHDGWAESETLETVHAERFYQAITALENRFILQRLGSLQGKRVLDIGCGLGESSIMFARQGAQVTAADISEEMVKFASRLAEKHGLAIDTKVGPAESLVFSPGEFDVIFTANTIHHLVDRRAFMLNVNSWLKKDGTFCCWEPVKYNPAINVYRRMAMDVRTPDERPLGRADLKMMREVFPNLETRHFWLLALGLFFKYYVIDRLNPNKVRYWKHIYSEIPGRLWWWRPLELADRLLLRLPLLRWWSWNIVILGSKEAPATKTSPL
jgi:SAM-dependent methyltransferase